MYKIRFLLSIVVISVALWVNGYRADLPYDDVRARYETTQSRWIDAAGARLHYTDQGTGPLIVLLHGSGSELGSYTSISAQLSQLAYRVVTLDLPGSGLSVAGPDTEFHNADSVELVYDFLTALDSEPLAIGGHSTGAQIAWTLALDKPQLFDRLILLAPTGQPIASPLTWRIAQTPVVGHLLKNVTPEFVVRMNLKDSVFDDTRISDATVGRYHDLLLRQGARDALFRRMQNVTFTRIHELPCITQPTLVIWGKEDAWLPVSLADAFDAAIPVSDLIVLPDTGHNIPEEVDAVTFAKSIDAWLARDLDPLPSTRCAPTPQT